MSGPNDGLKVYLRSQSDQGKPWAGQTGAAGWEFEIGRAEDSDLFIPYDIQVSRHHARLRLSLGGGAAQTENEVWLTDLGSSNGSFVGEQLLTEPALLTLGTLFRVGHTFLCLEEIDA
jgi:pSer/pThr/pTyr-binding forkhead associated (FHA) protein